MSIVPPPRQQLPRQETQPSVHGHHPQRSTTEQTPAGLHPKAGGDRTQRLRGTCSGVRGRYGID